MHSPRDALPEAKGRNPRGRCSSQGRGMLSAEPGDALSKAGIRIPPGMISLRPLDALPRELCLPTRAAQSFGFQLHSWGRGGQLGPPQKRCRRAVGLGGEMGMVSGVALHPCLLPTLPQTCCPASWRTPGLPPLPCPCFWMHLSPAESPLQKLVSFSLSSRPRLHLCSDPLHRHMAAGDPAPGIRRLHSRCHGWVAAPGPPSHGYLPRGADPERMAGTRGSVGARVWGWEAIGEGGELNPAGLEGSVSF